jgi:hypothetical protein
MIAHKALSLMAHISSLCTVYNVLQRSMAVQQLKRLPSTSLAGVQSPSSMARTCRQYVLNVFNTCQETPGESTTRIRHSSSIKATKNVTGQSIIRLRVSSPTDMVTWHSKSFLNISICWTIVSTRFLAAVCTTTRETFLNKHNFLAH